MKILPTDALSDAQLVAEVKRLVRGERETVARLVVHLAEMDSRPIHLAAGFPSLYVYCLEELHLSEYEAYHRIEVARAGKAFPQVFRLLAEGALSMTAAQLLARRLTAENHNELLRAASGRTKREVQVLLARHFPLPDAPASVRKLAQPSPVWAFASGSAPPVVATGRVSASPALPPNPVAPVGVATPTNHRPVVTPLAPDRYRVTFTADAETCELLAQAKDMLGHAVPSRDTAEVMKRALKALLKDLARKKFAATDRPRKSAAHVESGTRSGPSRRHTQPWSTMARDNGSAQEIQRQVASTTTQRPFS